jgi:hypothetical protein
LQFLAVGYILKFSYFFLTVISAFPISDSFLEMHIIIFWGLFYLRNLFLIFSLESDNSLEVASSLLYLSCSLLPHHRSKES